MTKALVVPLYPECMNSHLNVRMFKDELLNVLFKTKCWTKSMTKE